MISQLPLSFGSVQLSWTELPMTSTMVGFLGLDGTSTTATSMTAVATRSWTWTEIWYLPESALSVFLMKTTEASLEFLTVATSGRSISISGSGSGFGTGFGSSPSATGSGSGIAAGGAGTNFFQVMIGCGEPKCNCLTV